MTGLRRCETHLEGAGRVALLRRSWVGTRPVERVLLVVHGLFEHSERYDAFGAWFAERGCAVHAYDQRGHGRSQGVRGHARGFDPLLDDLQVVLGAVAAEHPGVPVTLVGHSMGGLVAAAFLRERKPAIESAVLSGAALGVSERPRSPLLLALGALARLAPRMRRSIGLDPFGLSRDPHVVRRYVEDPLVFSDATLGLVRALMRKAEETVSGGAAVDVPVLLLHGADDPICPAEGSRRFFETLASEGSEFRAYPGLRHEIFNEPEAERIFAEILDWLAARAGEPGAQPGRRALQADRAACLSPEGPAR